jgi:hypothetical protein
MFPDKEASAEAQLAILRELRCFDSNMPFEQLNKIISPLPNMFKYYIAYANMQFKIDMRKASEEQVVILNIKTRIIVPYHKAQLSYVVSTFDQDDDDIEEIKNIVNACRDYKEFYEELYEKAHNIIKDKRANLKSKLHWALNINNYEYDFKRNLSDSHVLNGNINIGCLLDIHTIATMRELDMFINLHSWEFSIEEIVAQSKQEYDKTLDVCYNLAIDFQIQCWSDQYAEWQYYREIKYLFTTDEICKTFAKLKDIQPEHLKKLNECADYYTTCMPL